MEEELVEAARVGDVGTFNRIMEQDPDTLERACSGHADSPLHLAARRGTAEIVKQIVTRLPSLATETNQQGMTPLHLASLKGYVETVRELLKAKLDEGKVNQCLLKDEEGWTPLHCASQKGKICVIEELIRACPQCLKHVTEKRDTVLHVAAKANQFEAVKVLEDSIKRHNLDYLLKAKDQRGKSADQIEAAKKSQSLQVVEVLKEDDEIREERHINIEEEGNEETEASNKKDQETMSSGERQAQQNAILVVATLIITLTYQALANPPTTLLIDGSTKLDWGCLSRNLRSHNLTNQLKECPAALAVLFLLFNTMIFFQSILIVVMALRGKTNALLEFGKVVSAKEQVVAGTMYYIMLEATDGCKKKIYETKIWEKPWLNFKEVQELKPVDDAPAESSS